MRLGAPIAAATTVAEMPMSENNASKTVLVYHAGEGFEFRRHIRRNRKTETFRLSPAELQGLILHWPVWRDWLLNAGVDDVAPTIPFQSVSTASPEPSSSPSSPTQESLL